MIKPNQIYHGDNLQYMSKIPKESIDLIYIDPPFATQTLWSCKNNKKITFNDSWNEGLAGYLEFMEQRLKYMHKLLKSTGSLFVHIDWRTAHYIKIKLDQIFGTDQMGFCQNFINEIIWFYPNGGGRSKSRLNKKHDTILWYAKDKTQFKYNWQDISLTRNKDQKTFGGYFKKDKKGTYQEVRANNKIYKYYIDEPKNNDDVWFLNIISQRDKTERLNYPTQKPLDLLQRIILMASDKNDLVADFFCGCGTTLDAAQSLNRKWIGFDASKKACGISKNRIKNKYKINTRIQKQNLENLNHMKHTEFEKAVVGFIGGFGSKTYGYKLAFDGTPIFVIKQSDDFNKFYPCIKQHGRGILISKQKLKIQNPIDLWKNEGLDIQLLSLEDILNNKFTESSAA